MNSTDKASAIASIWSIGVGIIVTLYVWARTGYFDPNQVTPILTMVMMCFLLTGVHSVIRPPTRALEALIGPRQVLMPLLGIGLMWLFTKCGVDYTAIGKEFGLRNPFQTYFVFGAVAGYCAAEVYILAALTVYDIHNSLTTLTRVQQQPMRRSGTVCS